MDPIQVIVELRQLLAERDMMIVDLRIRLKGTTNDLPQVPREEPA